MKQPQGSDRPTELLQLRSFYFNAPPEFLPVTHSKVIKKASESSAGPIFLSTPPFPIWEWGYSAYVRVLPWSKRCCINYSCSCYSSCFSCNCWCKPSDHFNRGSDSVVLCNFRLPIFSTTCKWVAFPASLLWHVSSLVRFSDSWYYMEPCPHSKRNNKTSKHENNKQTKPKPAVFLWTLGGVTQAVCFSLITTPLLFFHWSSTPGALNSL